MGNHPSGLIRFGLLGAVLNIAVTVGLTEGAGAPEEMAFAVAAAGGIAAMSCDRPNGAS